ncbi:MAG: flagellar biosynthetic protein FliO, partial [candidate division Zixibacteria bacterium]|nr:flagellar biosynthetic protein FliO [candidate division Zixibacteria bacterium]
FGIVSADEVETKEESVVMAQADNAKDKTVPTSTRLSGMTTKDEESLVGPLVKLILALVAVVGGIYGFLMVLRKMMGSKFSANKGNHQLETIETTYIAQKKSVSLIRYGEKAVLVGVADNSISVLAELDREETKKIISDYTVGKRETGFKSVFAGAREKVRSFDMKDLNVPWIPKENNRPQEV